MSFERTMAEHIKSENARLNKTAKVLLVLLRKTSSLKRGGNEVFKNGVNFGDARRIINYFGQILEKNGS